MRFHRAYIQFQNFGNLEQSQVLIVPQRKHRSLSRAKFVQSLREPPLDLGGKDLILGAWMGCWSKLQDGGLIAWIGPFTPKLPSFGTKPVQAGVDGDSSQPLGRIIQLRYFRAPGRLPRF